MTIEESRKLRDELAALDRQRIEDAVALVEGALHGTAPRRGIWDDSDYLVATLAILTGDGMRAREAAIASFKRTHPPEVGAW